MTTNPTTTDRNCKMPANLRELLCHLVLSLGRTSLTVTYSKVPPARPCKIGNTILDQSVSAYEHSKMNIKIRYSSKWFNAIQRYLYK